MVLVDESIITIVIEIKIKKDPFFVRFLRRCGRCGLMCMDSWIQKADREPRSEPESGIFIFGGNYSVIQTYFGYNNHLNTVPLPKASW